MNRPMAIDGSDATRVSPSGPDFLEGFVSEEDYAARRGVSIRTCQRDRQLRQSPPYVVIGRRVFYRVAAVRDWLIARERTADGRPAAPRAGKVR